MIKSSSTEDGDPEPRTQPGPLGIGCVMCGVRGGDLFLKEGEDPGSRVGLKAEATSRSTHKP